jgi:ATP-binding cassette subfamily C protein
MRRGLDKLMPELLGEFLRFAGWRRMTAALAAIVAGAVFEGAGILILIKAVQLLLVAGPPGAPGPEMTVAAPGWFAGMGRMGQLAAALLFVVFVLAARGVVLTFRDTLLARLQHGFVQTVKLSLLARQADARWEDIVRHDRSVLVQILGSEMMQLAMAVHYGLSICVSLVFVASMAAFAIYLAPSLAILIFGFLAALLLASGFYLKRSGLFGKRLLDQDMAMSQTALRFFDTIKLAKAHGLQHSFLDRYSEASARALDQRVTFVRLLSASRNGLVAAGALIAVAATIWGTLVMRVPPLELMAFVVILLRLAGPGLSIQQGIQQIANSVPRFALAQQLTRDLSAPLVAAMPVREARVGAKGALVEVDGLGLRRPSSPNRQGELVDVSFTARSGEVLGLSGPSGAGKTTLLDIICGLVEPSTGRVRINGTAPSSSWHGEGAYLGHEACLFAGTLRDNLLWFAAGRPDSELEEALDRMGGRALLTRLEKGLDTWLLDGGSNLSTGERQRVALTRAILRTPTLILLDEATSSLDRRSEAGVLGALRALRTRPTVILVSHRTETLAACDRVVEIANGRLIRPVPELGIEVMAKSHALPAKGSKFSRSRNRSRPGP